MMHTLQGKFSPAVITATAHVLEDVGLQPDNVFFQFNISGEDFITFLKAEDKVLGYEMREDAYDRFREPIKQSCLDCIHQNVCQKQEKTILGYNECKDYLHRFSFNTI